jgi:RNA recognition motif-containing protein
MELPVDDMDVALFNTVTQVTVGNGEKATFWTSRWLHGQAPASLFPALYEHSKRKKRTVKEALTNDNWITDVDYDMTEQIIREFMGLYGKLRDVALSPLQEDTIIWMHTSDGQYTASSAYKIQFLGLTTSLTAEVTWQTKAPPRCRFFVWLMLQNRIWTAARLQIRGWPNDYFCPLCRKNLETVSHLFQECCFSRELWEKVATWITTTQLRPASWNQMLDIQMWFIDLSGSAVGDRQKGTRSMVMLTVWEIWKERNNRVFNRSDRSTGQVFNAIQEEAKIWVRAGNQDLQNVLPPAALVHTMHLG